MSPRVTRISRTLSPAEPYDRNLLHTPHDAPPTRHEVHIDLKQSGNPGSGPYILDPAFLSNVRAAVAQGDVDAVVMYHGSPTEEEWKALEGAQPWHLELVEGYTEDCWYEGLKDLTTPWPLRSMYLGAYNGLSGKWEESDEEGDEDEEDEDEDTSGSHEVGDPVQRDGNRPARALKTRPSFPACYSSIETLVLDYPKYQDLYFYPEGGAQNLRSLTICENEAAKTFACTVTCNPALTNTLETVSIHCPGSHVWYDFEGRRMKRFFGESNALRNVELVLGSGHIGYGDDLGEDEDFYARYRDMCPYTGLHSCLPPSLEFLSLSCPTDRLTFVDLDHWISSAKDSAWLPKLHTVAFSLALPGGRHFSLSWEEERELDGKVELFLELLRGRGVEIVEPRSGDEMHYPLPR